MKILKQEKGSITLFVLIAMLFFVMYLVGMYLLSSNAEISGLAETKRIKEIYEQGVNNIDDVYATLENNIKEWSNTYAETKIYTDSEGNTAWIPEGFQVCLREGENKVSDGLVIRNAEDLNEFVWIPCTIDGADGSIKYDRYVFKGNSIEQVEDVKNSTDTYKAIKKNSSETYYFYESISNDEKNSISTYGGYYIARYEAGIENGTLTSTLETYSTEEGTGWTGDNIKLVSKKDAQVWNYITKKTAEDKAKTMYTEGITSKLCSSYAWDTALKFIDKYSINTSYSTNSLQGNYADKAETLGKPALTGKTQSVCNIYDMGGNVWEWTTEIFNYQNSPCTNRGGDYDCISTNNPAAFRSGSFSTNAKSLCRFSCNFILVEYSYLTKKYHMIK